MTNLAFVDIETTGLDPDRHQIWEVAIILRGGDGLDRPRRWLLPVNVEWADPEALDIGGFHDRHPQGTRWSEGVTDSDYTMDMYRFAAEVCHLTYGAHLVGAVVSFDEERLRRLMQQCHIAPLWHYHLVDVEALVAGKWSIQPPWDSSELSRLVHVDPDQFDRHTAMGDARWARAMYDAVMRP